MADRVLRRVVQVLSRLAERCTGLREDDHRPPRERGLGRFADASRHRCWSAIAALDIWRMQLPRGRWPLVRQLTWAPRWAVREARPFVLPLEHATWVPIEAEIAPMRAGQVFQPTPERVFASLARLFPNRRLPAPAEAAAFFEELGLFSGENAPHAVPYSAAGLFGAVTADGSVGFRPARDAGPLPSSDVVEVVDVLFPLYVALVAVRSGVHRRMLDAGRRRRVGQLRWRADFPEWLFDLGEHGQVRFPGEPPARPDGGICLPRGVVARGSHLSHRRGDPRRICRDVLVALLGGWGYEPDEQVIAEVLDALEARRLAVVSEPSTVLPGIRRGHGQRAVG